MDGSIIKQTGSGYYLCTGAKYGMKEGQVVDVYATEEDPAFADTPIAAERVYAGQVKITNIVNPNCADAVLISGKAEAHDFVDVK